MYIRAACPFGQRPTGSSVQSAVVGRDGKRTNELVSVYPFGSF
jgi:hypothetical protein